MAADRKHELLVDELKQTVGEEAVERADLDVDRALERRPSRAGAALRSSRLLLIITGAVLLVVGVIASLAFENWIFFGAAIAAHALLATVVIASALALATDEGEKPAATAEAALEEEGVSDPGAALGDLVDQVESRDTRPS